jgi:hypothetical protein
MKTREFVKRAREIGQRYQPWGWSERLGWLAADAAGTHTYKGVSIPNDTADLRLRAHRIAYRAHRQQVRLAGVAAA